MILIELNIVPSIVTMRVRGTVDKVLFRERHCEIVLKRV